MSRRVPAAVGLIGALATVAGVGCGSSGGGVDKAGGSGEPVVLRMASVYGDLGDLPAIRHFVDQVEELSGGELRIKVADGWGGSAVDAEEQVVRDVSAGEVDLGWAGTRVLDRLGVTSFQALTAPMLVDSYALENAVVEDEVTEQMLDGLDEIGVVGLSVFADGLRKPIGVNGPLVNPADWHGITFGTAPSNGQVEAIRALGATPELARVGSEHEDALEEGAIQGFEMNLYNYARNPSMQQAAPYVTANVNLWPLMDVLLANPDRLADLTDEQRGWLEAAAGDAAARSAGMADRAEADLFDSACHNGGRYAEASPADLAALERSFAVVYANLEQDPETAAFIQQLKALKESTPPGPDPSIPAKCTGKTLEPTDPRAGHVGPASAFLNGTYRYEITLDEAEEADQVDPEDSYPIVDTIVLEDGDLEGGPFGVDGGTYTVKGDRIEFYSIEYDETTTVTFERDEDGNLHLTPVPPIDPGSAFMCCSQVWIKIG